VARPPLARSCRLLLAAAFLLAALVPGVGGPARAQAQEPAPPATGWQVDRVRFEPVRPDGTLFVAGKSEYRGALEVNGLRGLAVINEVTVDDYLRGLAEMPSSWPMEALEAQAIAGRTYLLWDASSGVRSTYKGVGAHICATQACQVYNGVAKVRGAAGERWDQAVTDTSGQVLLTPEGRVVLAKYSSSNGGRSVASNRSYLQAVDDPDDAAMQSRGRYGHGIGMSQYGALGKALRGMAAADILAAYYGGIRPTQLRPEQLPATVRVALGWDEEVVRLGGPSPFRVLDGAGNVLSALTGGQWEVRRAPDGRLQVTPPTDLTGVVRVVPDEAAAAPGEEETVVWEEPEGEVAELAEQAGLIGSTGEPVTPPLSTAGTVVAGAFMGAIVLAVVVHLVRAANRPLL
jgi:hypothetical protein